MRYSYILARHRRALKRTCLVVAGAAACAVVVWQLDHHLSYARSYSFVFDKRLSPQAQRSVASTVEHLIRTKKMPPAQLIEHVHGTFEFIKKVAIFTIPSRRAIAKVIMHKPLCLLGESEALLSNGMSIDRNLLAEQIVAITPHVNVRDWFAGDETLPSKLSPFLKTLGPEKMKEFLVSWRGEHEVLLTDRQDPTFSILVEGQKNIDKEIFTKCTTVKALLATRGLLNTPTKRQWTADTRFKNQVIVFTGKRGEDHGSRSF